MRPALGARGVAVDIAHKTPPMGIGNMFRPVSRLPLTLRNVRWEPVCQFDAAKTDLGWVHQNWRLTWTYLTCPRARNLAWDHGVGSRSELLPFVGRTGCSASRGLRLGLRLGPRPPACARASA